MSYIFGTNNFANGQTNMSPVVADPRFCVWSECPELTISVPSSWDDVRRATGVLLWLDLGSVGHWFCLNGKPYRRAVEANLWSEGIKVYRPQYRIEGADLRLVGPSSAADFKEARIGRRQSSPPGTQPHSGLLYRPEFHPDVFRRFAPANYSIRVWAVHSKADIWGSYSSTKRYQGLPGDLAGPLGDSWSGNETVAPGSYWAPFTTYYPLTRAQAGYAVVRHEVSFADFKTTAQNGVGAVRAAIESVNDGAEVSDRYLAELSSALESWPASQPTLAFPLIKYGQFGIGLPLPAFGPRVTSNGEGTSHGGFSPRPPFDTQEEIDGWEQSVSAYHGLYLAGSGGTVYKDYSAFPALPPDGVLAGLPGRDDGTASVFGCDGLLPLAGLLNKESISFGGAKLSVGRVFGGYFPLLESTSEWTPEAGSTVDLSEVFKLRGGKSVLSTDIVVEWDQTTGDPKPAGYDGAEQSLLETALMRSDSVLGTAYGTLPVQIQHLVSQVDAAVLAE